MNQDLVESFSGVRGIYGKGITTDLAKKYASAYFDYFKPKTLIIAGDTRPSTKGIKKAMMSVLPCQIIDLGVVPIQVAEYAVLNMADGGIYITASHNEPDYSGWKMLKQDGAILYPEQIEKIIEMAHNCQEFKTFNPEVINKQEESIENYIKAVLGKLGESQEKIKKSNFKILADPNGGSAITVLKKLFSKLNVNLEIINNKLGEFNRKVEPNFESLAPLREKLDDSFSFGFGFDCDADRVELVLPSNSSFVDEMGPMVSGHYVLALACDSLLKGTKGEVVVTNDVTSYLVRDVIKKYEASIVEVEVGEINVVSEMEKHKSIIGGEGSSSGVIVFPIKCRDGLMGTILALKLMADTGKSLSDILDTYPKYYSKREKMVSENPVSVKKELERHFRDRGHEIKKTGGETGGLKILFDQNSFLWFRQSKTEPSCFRIHTEGDSKEKVETMLQEGVEVFKKCANL